MDERYIKTKNEWFHYCNTVDEFVFIIDYYLSSKHDKKKQIKTPLIKPSLEIAWQIRF